MTLFRQATDAARPAFVVAGGVAANATVRRVLQAAAERHGFSFTAPPMAYCTDNAAMIALAGLEHFARACDKPEAVADLRAKAMGVAARPRWPLDEARALAQPVHKTAGRKGAKA